MHKTHELTPVKLSVHARLSRELISELNLDIGLEHNDFINDTFTARLEAKLIEMASEKRTITFYKKPQNFWDCLLRRTQEFTLEVNRKEILNNPPKFPGKSTMLYSDQVLV